ncbi:major facilitator superfamily domain-containing protein [Penicillium brevicompactum]|uniref:Major facilitator superfamily domain-containing protein n=1 Tax=Penicillium brevicompactum TaxID=5074 RepID=A0A9W9QA56_PENBR|nr:major facilitator superfamily domain-containing protein [Penicillium brevicompactum]
MTSTSLTESVPPHPLQEIELQEPHDGAFINQELAPTDRGLAAWKLLGTAFVFESLLWGKYYIDYYSELPEFADSRYISVVGTVASGISYLGAPLTAPFIKRYQRYQRQMIWIGCTVSAKVNPHAQVSMLTPPGPICILALVAGSFANTLETLILTQGVAYGVGFLIFYYPILNMVNEYWIARRGMAYGLLCSATGVSGAVMPFIMGKMLDKYGYRITLRAVAVALFILTGPLIPFLKGRLPASRHTASATAKSDWSFLRTPLFWVYSASNIAQGLGYFLPSLYLPSYARSIGLSNTEGALLLALMSVAQVVGQFTFGFLSDKSVSVNLLITLSSVGAAVAAFTIWGFAHSLAPLVAFALIYGFFGAGYVAMWARMSTFVSTDPTATSMIFGLFCFGKGIGNVATGPLGGNLILQGVELGNYGLVKYMAVVIFTGACMALSALVVCSRSLWKSGLRDLPRRWMYAWFY